MFAVLEAGIPLLIGIAYGYRVAKLQRIGRAPSAARQVAFICGLLLVAITAVPPLGPLSGDLVLGHMITHTLLTDEASLLFAIGLTGPVLGPVMTAPGLRWFRQLTHPVVVLVLWIGVIFAWHTPALYQAASGDGWIHMLEHASFITVGTLLWMSVLGTFPQPSWFGPPARVGLVVVAHLSMMGLANILMWSGDSYYPDYAQSALDRGIDPQTDQGIAGAILMLQGGLIMISVFVFALMRWQRVDMEKQHLLDFALAHGVKLDPERAARAASAGTGDLLRSRIERVAGEHRAVERDEPVGAS